jgi:hypothetical protein
MLLSPSLLSSLRIFLLIFILLSCFRRKKQHGGHQQKQHNVVSHNKPKEKHHNREHDPVYIGSGDIKEHTYSLSDNLTKKDKHMVEKLEAQMEYADAHDNPDEAHKLQERIQEIVDKADARTKVPHDAKVKVVHHGGHKHKHEHAEES